MHHLNIWDFQKRIIIDLDLPVIYSLSMSFLYRMLGVLASINHSLGRLSINFIPVNFGLIVLSGGIGLVGLGSAYAGLTGQQEPRKVTVDEVFKGNAGESLWVEIEGELHNELVTQYGPVKKGSEELKSVDDAWSPMIDWKTGTGIMISLKNKHPDEKVEQTKMTGMVRRLDPAMKSELMKTNGKIGPISINKDIMIEEGQEPGGGMNNWFGWLFGAAFASGSLAMIFLTFTGNTVFKKEVRQTSERLLAGNKPDIARLTGKFLLPEKNKKKRFIATPGIVPSTEDGTVLLVANVDASSTFMGFTTSSAKGYWYITGIPKDAHVGILYWGGKAYPSIRFTVDGSKTIISYETAADRQAALNAFSGQGVTAFSGL